MNNQSDKSNQDNIEIELVAEPATPEMKAYNSLSGLVAGDGRSSVEPLQKREDVVRGEDGVEILSALDIENALNDRYVTSSNDAHAAPNLGVNEPAEAAVEAVEPPPASPSLRENAIRDKIDRDYSQKSFRY